MTHQVYIQFPEDSSEKDRRYPLGYPHPKHAKTTQAFAKAIDILGRVCDQYPEARCTRQFAIDGRVIFAKKPISCTELMKALRQELAQSTT